MSVIRYRPEIDGMRTLAILPVVLFHFGCSWIPGGFMGVDVFFVISGFLITAIILKEQEQGVFSLRGFWSRRIRRIMPALLAMLAVTLAIGLPVLFFTDLHRLADQAISALTVSANFRMLKLTGDYWGPAAESLPLLHTWSLAVEEQFYLVYPLLLLALPKLGRRRMVAVLAVLAVASLAICLWRTPISAAKAFYHPHTRAWELLAGGLAAFAVEPVRRLVGPRWAVALVHVGLAAIVASFFLIGGGEGFPGYKAMLPVAGSVLVMLFAQATRSPLERVLSSAPVVYVGRMSYSLYLWHWPVIVFGRGLAQSHGLVVPEWAPVVTMGLLAFFSLEVIEARGKATKRIGLFVVVGLVLVLGLAWFAKSRRMPVNAFEGFAPVEWAGDMYNADIVLRKPKPESVREKMKGILTPSRNTAATGISGGVGPSGENGPTLMMWGDSHAAMWADVVNDACGEVGIKACFQVADGTPPFLGLEHCGALSPDEKRLFDSMRMAELKRLRPKVIIVVANWSSHLGDGHELRELLGAIRSVNPECRVILPAQPPVADIGDVNALQFAVWRKMHGGGFSSVAPSGESRRLAANQNLAVIANEFPRVCVVSTDSLYFQDARHVRFADDNRLLYIDDDHLSRYGASLSKATWIRFIRASLRGDLSLSNSL